LPANLDYHTDPVQTHRRCQGVDPHIRNPNAYNESMQTVNNFYEPWLNFMLWIGVLLL